MGKDLKKVLIITYYWPPSGGSGVQRWLYFVKYLRDYGWEPIVYTVEQGEYPYLDDSLKRHIPEGVHVLRRPIWEPYSYYRKILGSKGPVDPTVLAGSSEQSTLKHLALWIRGNFFIPDPRIFWVRPSVTFLSEWISQNPVDLIVSTGPPHSMHLIARSLKKRCRIPWLADFRDPWTGIFFFDQLHLSSCAKWIHRNLEKKVLQEADKIVTVSPHCAEGLAAISNKTIEVITNGYDPFELPEHNSKIDRITMLYTGVLTRDRNPSLLWTLLGRFLNENPHLAQHFDLVFIGNVDPFIFDEIKANGMETYLRVYKPMPHKELQFYLATASILLLVGVPDQQGVVTGKLFEYLYLEKPVLSISPAGGDLEWILEQTNCGVNADFDESESMKAAIDRVFHWVQQGGFMPRKEIIHQYSRRNLTERLAQHMNQMLQ